MKIEETNIHIWDAARPDDEENVFVVNVYSPIVPRVGDHVLYWVDYPKHIPNGHKCQEREPIRISGTVDRVEIEYRRMRWSDRQHDITIVSIYLTGYSAELPENERA